MKRILAMTAALVLSGCGPKQNPDDTGSVDDALISFNVNAQATRYSEALQYVTEEEQVDMIDGSGNLKPEYKQAMTRLKLSALQKYNFTTDEKGRLVGMLAALKDANRRFSISDEQRKVGYDPNVPIPKPKNLEEAKAAKAAKAVEEPKESQATTPEPTPAEPAATGAGAQTETKPMQSSEKELIVEEKLAKSTIAPVEDSGVAEEEDPF